MSNIIKSVLIENFKSIRHIELKDCRRINLFIGKPNVGKSNLLEALSVFSLPYFQYAKKKNIQQFIRVENDSELFYDGGVNIPVNIQADQIKATILESTTGLHIKYTYPKAEDTNLSFSNLSMTTKRSIFDDENPFKSYFYPTTFDKEKAPFSFLLPPNGSNLMSIVSQLPQLKEELTAIFKEYGLKYVFDTNSQEIKIIKEKASGEIFLIPFQSIADTLKRLIFYKAAIESNENSVLIFEEPEAHAYPPYIARMAQSIIDSKKQPVLYNNT